MEISALKELYREIGQHFVECCERDGIPISPTFGLSRNISLTGEVYFEKLDGRIFEVFLNPAYGGPDDMGFDHWFSDRSDEYTDYLVLTISLRGIPSDLSQLLIIRNGWLNGQITKPSISRMIESLGPRT